MNTLSGLLIDMTLAQHIAALMVLSPGYSVSFEVQRDPQRIVTIIALRAPEFRARLAMYPRFPSARGVRTEPGHGPYRAFPPRDLARASVRALFADLRRRPRVQFRTTRPARSRVFPDAREPGAASRDRTIAFGGPDEAR